MSVFSKKVLVLLLFLLPVFHPMSPSCKAQDSLMINTPSAIEKAEIEWVSEWPSLDGKNQKKKTKNTFQNIIFGKKKQELIRPVSLIYRNPDSYWILDQECKAILVVNNKKNKSPHFIRKKNYNLASLVGICNFHDDFLFTDSYLNKIFLLNADKKECSVLNDSLKLDKPTGIAYSEVNNEIWVLETGAHRILVLNEKGDIIRTIGSRGTAKGEFNFPTHLWIDKKGNAYVVDAMNFRVQVFNNKYEVISVFGSNGDATGFFASPKGIATDSYGNIYIVDALFHAVQVFDIHGNFLYTFGSQGHETGEFWMPSGIYIDKKNMIYIADSYNSRIQEFQLITGGKK